MKKHLRASPLTMGLELLPSSQKSVNLTMRLNPAHCHLSIIWELKNRFPFEVVEKNSKEKYLHDAKNDMQLKFQCPPAKMTEIHSFVVALHVFKAAFMLPAWVETVQPHNG